MTKDLIIVGTGLFAEVACAYFEELAGREVIAFACHQTFKNSDEIYGRCLIAIEDLVRHTDPNGVEVFVAIGYGRMNSVRQRVYEELKLSGFHCATFVHPEVKIWDSATIGDNVFIFENNTIQPFTSIGDNTIVWSGNHVGHHSVIGRHCFISSHVVISGSCKVGDNVFLGVNSTIHDGISIGDRCLIGAGAIISRTTDAESVYVPVATKVFPKTSEEVGF